MKHSDNDNINRVLAGVLLWLVPALLLAPNIGLDITEIQYGTASRVANILLPAGVYLMLMSCTRRVGVMTLCTVPLMVLAGFQIVLFYLYGESIIAVDMFLNVVTTNPHEAGELLAGLATAIVVVCLLYVPALAGGITAIVRRAYAAAGQRRAAAAAGAILAAAGAGAMGYAMHNDEGYAPDRHLFPVNVLSNIAEAARRTAATENYARTSADFKFDAVRTDSAAVPEVYVMIIGETSRADNWQLAGYGRSTNPRLSQRQGLVFFPRVMSESNTTHKSVPLLMSSLDAASFGDSIYSSRSILEAFGEAGFATAWLSNQQRNHALIDFYGEQADTVHFITDDGRLHYDGELVEHLRNFIADNAGSPVFAVLHTYGSHFNYRERYPSGYAEFMPDDYRDADRASRQKLINAYDNSILYTDAVIDSIIGSISSTGRPAAVLYLSDHGEDIFDDSRNRFLHASPTPTYEQLHVPMAVWLSDAYRSMWPDKYVRLRANTAKNVSSSRSAFHTLLDVAHLSSPHFDARAAVTSPVYTEPLRVYLNDYNEAVDLQHSGLRQVDFDKMEQHRLSGSI